MLSLGHETSGSPMQAELEVGSGSEARPSLRPSLLLGTDGFFASFLPHLVSFLASFLGFLAAPVASCFCLFCSAWRSLCPLGKSCRHAFGHFCKVKTHSR